MASEEFLEVLHDLLRKIGGKQGYRVNDRNLYRPITPSDFTRRKGRWFSEVGATFPKTLMPQGVFDDMRTKLVAARDSYGVACLSRVELERLDDAWGQYQKWWASRAARSAESVPKVWWTLKAGADLSTAEGLYEFLRNAIYKPMLRGEFRKSKAAMKAVRVAFENGAPDFAADPRERLIQRDLILRESAFCLYRMSDDGVHAYADRMRQLLKDEPDRLILREGVQTYEYFADPSVEVVNKLSAFWLANTNATWDFAPQVGLVRMASAALHARYRADQKPAFLGGRSIEAAINDTCETMRRYGWELEADICQTNVLDGYAMQGDLDRLVDELVEFHARAHGRAFISPHQQAHLIAVEALGYLVVSQGKKSSELWAAGWKVRKIAELQMKWPGLRLRRDLARVLEDIRRATLAEFGKDTHMRVVY